MSDFTISPKKDLEPEGLCGGAHRLIVQAIEGVSDFALEAIQVADVDEGDHLHDLAGLPGDAFVVVGQEVGDILGVSSNSQSDEISCASDSEVSGVVHNVGDIG